MYVYVKEFSFFLAYRVSDYKGKDEKCRGVVINFVVCTLRGRERETKSISEIKHAFLDHYIHPYIHRYMLLCFLRTIRVGCMCVYGRLCFYTDYCFQCFMLYG